MPVDPQAIELVFGSTASADPLALDLVFGASAPPLDATLAGRVRVRAALLANDHALLLAAARVRVRAALLVDDQALLRALARVRVRGAVLASSAPTARLLPSVAAVWRDSDHVAVPVGLAAGSGASVVRDAVSGWQTAVDCPRSVRAPWRGSTPLASAYAVVWAEAVRRERDVAAPWHSGRQLHRAAGVQWQDATRLPAVETAAPWRDGATARLVQQAPWRDGRATRVTVVARSRQGRHARLTWVAPWRDGRRLFSYGSAMPLGPQPPLERPVDLHFCRITQGLDPEHIVLRLGVDPCAAPGAIVVPIREVYTVINTVSLSLTDGTPLSCRSMSLSLDADSWTYSFSAEVGEAEEALLQPGIDGAPVPLNMAINGTTFRLLAEQMSRERSFGAWRVRIGGRGRNAVLDAPYARIKSHGNPSAARTAAQLVDDALSEGGIGIGWTVDWQLEDWLVPAGAWAFQGTYMAAVSRIAAAAGGYVQPVPVAEELRILPRYPVAPWDWASATIDFELPAEVMVREGIEWANRAGYNRVFVSGESAGVLVQVTRAGTAGDVLAPMVTDALITDAAGAAGRQRGLSILGATGRQALVRLRLPVLPETGVIMPGALVRYVDGSVERIGLVRSTQVEVALPTVWQTIGVETHA